MLSWNIAQVRVVGTMLLCGVLVSPAWAQSEASSATPGTIESEQVLRERLQENVREREQLLQQLEDLGRKRDESLPKDERPQRYQDMTGPTGEAGATEETPVYELADISIVSKRVQKHPGGAGLSPRPRARKPIRNRPAR
jgi:iron complex outermembrane receptor protein